MLFRSCLLTAVLAAGVVANKDQSSNGYGSSASSNSNGYGSSDNSNSNSNGYGSGSSSGSSESSMGSSQSSGSSSGYGSGSSSSSQSGSSNSGSSSSSQPQPQTSPQAQAGAGDVQVQVVQVGNANGSLTFTPEVVAAPAGSFVQFQFWPKNHSVAQSTFDAPCVPITQTNTSVTNMIKSGFVPVQAGAAEIPVWTIQVNDTKPLWLYCGQTGHCQKGMVLAINSNEQSEKNLAAYKAKAAQFQGSGSNSTGSGSGSGLGGASGTSSSNPAQQTTNAAAKPVAGFLGVALAAIAGFAILL